jgi:EAL domain-containing protein (putative c-di-GMP-specific phosphodiesterase class I)/GGDEF domain-containing protein
LSEPTAVAVLVQGASGDPAEALNSLLRNAGVAAHCRWVPSAREVNEALAQGAPELLVAVAPAPTELAELAASRDHLAPAVPLLVLREHVDSAAAGADMARGARDTITLASPEHALAVIRRELRARRMEQALTDTLRAAQGFRRQLESVLHRSNDAIAQVQEGILVQVNDAWLRLLGHAEAGALLGQPAMDLFDSGSQPALKAALAACLQGRWSDHLIKAGALLADGSTTVLELMLAAGEFEGEPCVQLIVPAHKPQEGQPTAELADAVWRDPTTGLWQRQHLLQLCAQRLAKPPPGGVRCLAVIRPDGFTELAAELGATTTEAFLAQYAAQLRAMLGPNDLAGHFGAASLLVLLERGNVRDAEAWSTGLIERVAQHVFPLGARSVRATCSVGLAELASAEANLDEAVAMALTAVRHCGERGGNQVHVNERVNQDTRVLAYDQIWVKHIKAALAENRFHLVQQPIASLTGSAEKMFDIAVRMLDNQAREVLPSEFLPAAERNDLLRDIDRWVLSAALGLVARRQPDLLFVSLSRDSMLDRTLVEWLDAQLKATLAEPQRLCVQFTEEVATRYPQPLRQLLEELRKRRVKSALEDFGRGPDSLGLLETLGVDYLKIDGSLMQGLAGSAELQQRVGAIAAAAGKRTIRTIAERIEDANTMAVVWQLGVHYIQGYLVHAGEEVVLKS